MPRLQAKEYMANLKPIWCPGCGDFGVLNALCAAFATLELPSERLAVISGIGCSSRLPGYLHCYGLNGIHGRAIPVATGLKLSRPDVQVVVTMGDGDAYGIGGNHFIHAARRNLDLTCVIMDNRVYGMTKGQMSPTTPLGAISATTPFGAIEQPIHPLVLGLGAGATFAARGLSWDAKRLAALIIRGIQHRGFSVIDVLSPCVTFRPEDRSTLRGQVSWIKSEVGSQDRFEAMRLAASHEGHSLGIFFEENRPTYEDQWHDQVQKAKAWKGSGTGLADILATWVQPLQVKKG